MTPCEKLGYKVGDLFKVVGEDAGTFSKGSVVKLLEDDGTGAPLFQLIKGSSFFDSEDYEVLRYVKPLPNLPKEDFKINLSNMTDVEKSLAKEWLKKVAESRGLKIDQGSFESEDLFGVINKFKWLQVLSIGAYNYEYQIPELSLSFTTPEVKGWELLDNKSEKEAQLKLQLEQTIGKLQAALEEAEETLQSIKNN